MHCLKSVWFDILALAPVLWGVMTPGFAASNVDPSHAQVWSANIGWLTWRPDSATGVEVGQFICSGSIYSANLGWISLGNGSPANGIQYQNNSASDFGVNVDAAGHLQGFAYSANAGWIHFDSGNGGAPKVDLATGKLSGLAYGANIGWLSLGDVSFSLQVDSISAGADTDGDGIPDAWELLYAGNLTTFSATSDFDRDGSTDLEEYLAGTNPLDPNDNLRVVRFTLSPDKSSASISWTTKPNRQYRIATRTDFGSTNPWQDSNLGLFLPDGELTTRTLPTELPSESFRIEAFRPLSP